MFRRLVATPPKYSDGARATLQDKAVIDVQREVMRENQHKEPEKVPEPETFGAGLRRIRLENKLSATELGDLLGLRGGTAVLHWEADRNSPAADMLARLYVVLPELKAAVDVGAVKAPDVKRQAWSTARAAAHRAAEPVQPQLAIVQPEPELVKPALNTEPAPMITPEEHARIMSERKPAQRAEPAMKITKPGDPVADASNRYAQARLTWLRAMKAYNTAEAALAAAREARDKAQREHDEAQAQLDALVMDGAL
jgi:transcriptional regulator with XRE-family HTH domain